MKRVAEYEEYQRKVDYFFLAKDEQNKSMRSQMAELFLMGFTQFQENSMILRHYNGDINQACQTLLDTDGELERIVKVITLDRQQE